MDIVSFDLETTGTWVEKDKIIEFGAVKLREDGTKEILHFYVDPEITVPQGVLDLTKIPLEKIGYANTFKKEAPRILEFIEGCWLVGFNHIRFDLVILERQMKEAGIQIDFKSFPKVDAVKIYQVKERRDLTAAYKFYCGEDLVGAHSAVADADATLEIILAQAKKYGDGSLESIQNIDYETSNEFYDPGRKLRIWNGDLYITFGKHTGKSLEQLATEDTGYLRWILKSEFSAEMKQAVKDALEKAKSKAMPPFGYVPKK